MRTISGSAAGAWRLSGVWKGETYMSVTMTGSLWRATGQPLETTRIERTATLKSAESLC